MKTTLFGNGKTTIAGRTRIGTVHGHDVFGFEIYFSIDFAGASLFVLGSSKE